MHDYGLITPENLQTWVSEQKLSGTFLLTPSTTQGVPKPQYWFGEFIIISKDTFNDFAIYLFTDAEFYCCVTSAGQWSNSWLQIHPNKYYTNPNLLDNWYFPDPVNQRNGYIIPAGTEYNDLSWNHAGTTDKAYRVVGYSGQDPLITIDGTNYIVGVAAQVPGYCTSGYTVDRWWLGFNSENSSLQPSNGGVIYNAGTGGNYDNFSQPYLKDNCIVGQLYTISFLVDNFQNVRQVFNDQTGSNFNITDNLISYTFSYNSIPDNNPAIGIQFKQGTSTLIRAAKLELGDHQTLAHKEGDTWVLNEIPDFGEQLARCQRHAFSPLYEAYATAVICNLFISRVEKGIAFGEVTLPVSMRSKPVFSGNASKFWIVPENGGEPSHPTLIYVMGLSADKAMIQVNGSYAANTQYILYIENPFTSADFLLSADL